MTFCRRFQQSVGVPSGVYRESGTRLELRSLTGRSQKLPGAHRRGVVSLELNGAKSREPPVSPNRHSEYVEDSVEGLLSSRNLCRGLCLLHLADNRLLICLDLAGDWPAEDMSATDGPDDQRSIAGVPLPPDTDIPQDVLSHTGHLCLGNVRRFC